VLLARKFNRMRKVYRGALPVLSSKQKWEEVLVPGGQEPSDRGGIVESSPANG
jgi:galactofuranosylgalactofuranosylrhamnosyl-N-acetylglucosaminyl-diphospho-decaprenol beta-1,5/1,6-galactofuranosyltransferase